MATQRELLQAVREVINMPLGRNQQRLVPPQMDEATAARWRNLRQLDDYMHVLRNVVGAPEDRRPTDAEKNQARQIVNQASRDRVGIINRFEKNPAVLDRVSESVLSGETQNLQGEELLMAAGTPQGLSSGVFDVDVLRQQAEQIEQNLPQETQLPTQGGEVESGTGRVSAGTTLGPSGPTANRLAPGGQMAQYDIINPQTGAVVGSTQDPTAATSQGFQVRLRDGSAGSGLPRQGGEVRPGTGEVSQPGQQSGLTADQIFRAFSRGGNRSDIEAALRNIGWPDAGIQASLDQIQAGNNPTYSAPPGATQAGTQQPGQTQQPAGTQPGAQGTGGAAPTSQQFPTAVWQEGATEPPPAALEIFNELRNGQINTDTAITRLMPLMQNGTPESAMRLLQERVLGAAADGGNTLAEQFGSGLGGPDLMQQRGLGDVSRAFALQSGVAPAFRDLVQQQAGRQAQLAFPLQAAMGTAPGTSGMSFQDAVTSPGAFEQFLQQGQVPSGIGQSLRQAADFLRSPGQGALGGAEAIQQMLTGPSGSVGSELFSPTIGLALQNAGRRFLPGVGQAARSGTSSALENMFAQDPTRFQSAPDFIDFLARQRVI